MTTLTRELDQRVLTLTIDNPPLNPLHSSLAGALEAAVAQAQSDPEVRVIVLTGSGERGFCVGGDIKEFGEVYGPKRLGQTLVDRHRLLDAIENSRKPVIAALNGLTLGGGLELAISCHIRLAADTAQLGLPEINLGIIPGWAGTQRLPRLVGIANALEIMLLGDRLTAARALEIGLVHRVFEQSQFRAKVAEFALVLADKAPLAVAAILESVARYAAAGFEAGSATERECSQRLSSSGDALEGITAFMQKRKPEFKGK